MGDMGYSSIMKKLKVGDRGVFEDLVLCLPPDCTPFGAILQPVGKMEKGGGGYYWKILLLDMAGN